MVSADAGYRAIAYDRRGFGRSSQRWSGYDEDTLADDLACVIEHTGARDAVLIGFSMGGGGRAPHVAPWRQGAGKWGQAYLAGMLAASLAGRVGSGSVVTSSR
jgi:pimeloyl-ACP methyl ester carboxylesterase